MENVDYLKAADWLGCAASTGNTRMLQRALELRPSAEDMSRAVMLSCASGQLQILHALLEHGAPAEENAMWAACRAGNAEAIKVLVSKGVPFTQREAEMCARSGHVGLYLSTALSARQAKN